MGKTRLMRGDTVIMAKTTGSEQDVAGDVADAVGTAIGSIVNEIEKLDARRGELIEQLRKASERVSSQLSKYIPAGVTELPRKAKEGYDRTRRTLNRPCSICGFKTDPYHDGRLKAHRDQGEKKKPLSDTQLAELGMRRVE